MSRTPAREYVILYAGGRVGGPGGGALGGNAATATDEHPMDGPEHTNQEAFQKTAEKDQPDGYAGLDAAGRLAPDQVAAGSPADGDVPTIQGDGSLAYETPGGAALVPYFVADGETYAVPEFRQALWAMTIDNEGTLAVDGFLIEVD